MTRRYDLLAIDLDGTLLCSRHAVSRENVEAIRRAKDAGMRVSICTGRGYNECKQYAAQIDQTDPMIVAGGAIVSDGPTGRTLQRFGMRLDLVRRLVNTLNSHGHAALVLKDPAGETEHGLKPGHDYLVVSPEGEKAIDPISRWWFKAHNIGYHVVKSLDADEHPELTVRVGVCGSRQKTRAAAEKLREAFSDEATFHHFHAVIPTASSAGSIGGTRPDFSGRHVETDDDQILVLEAFDKTVNKWTGVRWLAEHAGVDCSRVAAIGNDINDIALLQSAACGVAMGNAIPECRDAAHRHTLDNDEHGVAHAIDQILEGKW